jgi:hypothetical protein
VTDQQNLKQPKAILGERPAGLRPAEFAKAATATSISEPGYIAIDDGEKGVAATPTHEIIELSAQPRRTMHI